MEDQALHHFMQDLAPIIIGTVLIIAAAWVVTTFVIAFRDKANLRTRAELYAKLLNKFGSNAEFTEYLQTDAGRQIFDELPQTSSPMKKILGAIQKGVILILLGAGLLILSNIFDNSLGGDLFIILAVSGTVAVMVGAGFLISTGIVYRLSKSWGLIATETNMKKSQDKTADDKKETQP